VRILYITHSFPYPLTSGRLRHYFLVRELSQRHEITCLALADSNFQPEHAAALRPFTRRVEVITSRDGRGLGPKVWRRIRHCCGTKPSVMKGLRKRAIALLAAEPFDAVVSSMAGCWALEALDLPPLVADICDANRLYYRSRMQHSHWLRRMQLWLESRCLERLEQAVLEQADHALFISPRDRAEVLNGRTKPSSIVANGLDLAYWKRRTGPLGRDTIIFTGSMRYPPNVDAALLLIREVLPRVRRAVPRAKLLIVGHSPTRALLAAGRGEGVTVTGFVNDMRPYLEQATLFAAPLRFGAGLQNKLIEAMSMQLPVVTTSLAAAGLVTESGQRAPVQTADHPRQLAELVIQDLLARQTDRTPETSGRRFVQENFSWSRSAEIVEDVLHELVQVTQLRAGSSIR